MGQRKEVNHLKGNLNKVVFEMQPPAPKQDAQPE